MFFGETYLAYSTIEGAEIVTLKGRVRRRDETMSLQAMELSLPDTSAGPDSPVLVTVPVSRCTQPVVERLRDILRTHPGATEVHLKLTEPGRATLMKVEDEQRRAVARAVR